MKTKTFVSLLILAVLLLLVGGYYYYSHSRTNLADELQSNESADDSLLTLFINNKVISPVLSFSNETVWFMEADGRLYRVALDGSQKKEEYMLPEILENPVRVIWQRHGSSFIVEQNLNGYTRYRFFDANAKTFVSYSDRLRKPQFAFGESKIVYDWVRDDGGHELKISDLDGQNFQKITDLFRPDYELASSPVKNEVVLFSRNQSDLAGLYLIDLVSREFREIGPKASYDKVIFSPDGAKLLVMRWNVDSLGPIWQIFDLLSGLMSDVNIDAGTWTAVAWNKAGSEILFASKEGVKKYSLGTKTLEDVYKFDAEENVIPSELIYHPDLSMLLIVDQITGALYRMDLPR